MSKTIYILYYSGSGNTKAIAEKIVEKFSEIKDKSVEIIVKNAKEFIIKDDAVKELKNASAFVIGSPDYYSYPAGYIKQFFDDIFHVRNQLTGRPAFGFLSHGGGGRATKPLESLLKSIKLNVISPIISVRGKNITIENEELIGNCCKELLNLLE